MTPMSRRWVVTQNRSGRTGGQVAAGRVRLDGGLQLCGPSHLGVDGS